MSERERDQETGTETTGHEWDGIKELDTPLPRWWLWTFYATIVWGLGYTIAYPAWPMITEATSGALGYSSRAELSAIIEAHKASNAQVDDRIAAASFEDIRSDADLDSYAQSGGAAVFRTYCSQCHGAGAAGAVGYPNLIDDDWLWGGTEEEIAMTVRYGIRWETEDESRFSEMPAFGADEILVQAEIEAIVAHVQSLSDKADPNADGAALYADNCAACHGDEGLGDHDLGAPNLADAIWLYGGDAETLYETIYYSRAGAMPPWHDRLSESEIKQVSHYVHNLGGGE
ncbi:MAG: cytochrome-c oxidase, cbb3-type subunit III [Pseudomonadota bacterium]